MPKRLLMWCTLQRFQTSFPKAVTEGQGLEQGHLPYHHNTPLRKWPLLRIGAYAIACGREASGNTGTNPLPLCNGPSTHHGQPAWTQYQQGDPLYLISI